MASETTMSERHETLQRLRDDLEARLARYRDHRRRPLDKDSREQAGEVQNDEVVEALDQEAREELAQVRHALARLEAGEGELCERCGEAIDPRRLVALPYTTRCLRCADG